MHFARLFGNGGMVLDSLISFLLYYPWGSRYSAMYHRKQDGKHDAKMVGIGYRTGIIGRLWQ